MLRKCKYGTSLQSCGNFNPLLHESHKVNPLSLNAIVALVFFSVGFGAAVKYKDGVYAQEALAISDTKAAAAKKDIRVIDNASAAHTKELSKLNTQLWNAREKIASLSARECFSAATASLLNSTGDLGVPAASSESEGESGAITSGSGIRFTTERDAAGYIAICRTKYAEVASRLNNILVIEDKRHHLTKEPQ